jgi:hypothetical protein
MTEIINFFQNHYTELLAIIGSIVSIATVIVKITPSTKDDDILTKIVNLLEKFSLVNTKANQDVIDSNKSK